MNTILMLVPNLLRILASAPASSSFLTPSIDSILNSIAAFIEKGEEGATALQALNDHIKAMVNANRDPTIEEWNTLKARSDAAHTILQADHVAPPAD